MRYILTNETALFDKHAEGDARFVEFLKSAVKTDLTHDAIRRDTFPLAVTRNTIRPIVDVCLTVKQRIEWVNDALA